MRLPEFPTEGAAPRGISAFAYGEPEGPATAYRMCFAVGEHSAAPLRRILRMYLDLWNMSELFDAAGLALTELVANVVRHVPGRVCALRILRRPAGVRVEVADDFAPLPRLGEGDPWDEAGRGLRLVQALTDHWGVDPAPGGATGKTVWFECEVKGAEGRSTSPDGFTPGLPQPR